MVPPKKLVPTPTEPKFQTDEILLSEHTFDAKEEIPKILAFLRTSKATGLLSFHMANGGVNKCSFTQKQYVEVEV